MKNLSQLSLWFLVGRRGGNFEAQAGVRCLIQYIGPRGHSVLGAQGSIENG